MLCLCASQTAAEGIRIATFNTELGRDGPGLLLRDIRRGKDQQVEKVLSTIEGVRPDIIALQGFDYDLDGLALTAFREALAQRGLKLDHQFALLPNSGLPTALDLDGDGRTFGPGDAQGYGRFSGQGGMAVLSRFPIMADEVTDFGAFLWRDLPDALLPSMDGQLFPSPAALEIQRLHSHGAWVLPLRHPGLGQFHLLTYHASPPVFDGPEDRNGKRNHDETRFWSLLLDGTIAGRPPGPLILLGDANLDPDRGDGLGDVMAQLLARKDLQDPLPGQATVNWSRTGPMRVDYLLPSDHWRILGAGITPPGAGGSRHGLVWADLEIAP